jgi:hypothetical protein
MPMAFSSAIALGSPVSRNPTRTTDGASLVSLPCRVNFIAVSGLIGVRQIFVGAF